MRLLFRTILFVLPFLFPTCKEAPSSVERAFYYWKNDEKRLDSLERRTVDELDIDRLFVKFFDVVPDEQVGAKPVAKTSLRIPEKGALSEKLGEERLPEIVPTVFIRRGVLNKLSSGQVDSLAGNILHLCRKYYDERFSAYEGRELQEIQLDCDRPQSSKEAYAKLVKAIKKNSELQVTTTLRLYPYKYPEKMGVPPADRASLMCYNLYHPLKYRHENSIQDPEELKRYLKGTDAYPLPLDIVLPVFSRVHWYRNKRFAKTLDLTPEAIRAFSDQVEPLWYEVEQDTLVQDHYLRAGDRLKVETVSQEGMDEMIRVLKEHLHLDERTRIALFDLDSKDIGRFDHETLLHPYTAFGDQGQ